MDTDGPADAGGKELPGIVDKLVGVVRSVGLTFAESPSCLHTSCGLRVESQDLQLAHLVEVAFDNVQIVVYGALFVVKVSVWLDLNCHVTVAAVKFANVLDVAEKAHGIGGLSGWQMEERRELGQGDCRITFPVNTRGRIHFARCYRNDSVHIDLAVRLRRNARLCHGKRRLEIPALEADREKINLCDFGQTCSDVWCSSESARCGAQPRQQVRRSAGKFDVADPNLQGFDRVGDANQLPSLLGAFPKIVHTRGNLLLVEDRLERLLDSIGESSGKWHLSFEKRNSAL